MPKNIKWDPPSEWKRIKTIDAHTAGEPLRVFVDGVPEIPGDTILEKRRYAQHNLDQLRKAIIWEPRGHADMYGCILTEPTTEDGTIGVLFLHNEGFSTMCGHGIIGLTKVAFDTGLIQGEGNEPVIEIDTPAGRVRAQAHIHGGQVQNVTFQNVPSFVQAIDRSVSVPEIGTVKYDLAFGGAFYAFCHAPDLGLQLIPEESAQIIDLGKKIKKAVMENDPPHHPFEEDLSFLYGTIFIGPPQNAQNHSRNVCIFAEGELDRSPTGTGLSARAALHYAKKEIGQNESFSVESILGTCFKGKVAKTISYGPFEAVIPEISGTAHIVGRNEWFIDPKDPLAYGFFLR
jgi:trans-L-3-hydroxyproline dehydratase